MTLIIARRGAADVAPANSLAAIEQGIERGADGVEVEVRLSRDAELVVIREARMPFVGPVPVPVEDLTLAELKTIDIGAEQQGFRGTRISTMAEIVDLLAGSEARLVIDVKEDPLHSEGATPTAIAVAELVRACQLHERATITSTNHSSMAALAIAHPQLQIGGGSSSRVRGETRRPVTASDWSWSCNRRRQCRGRTERCHYRFDTCRRVLANF